MVPLLVLASVFFFSLLYFAFRKSKAACGTRAGNIRLPIQEVLENPEKITYIKTDVPPYSPQVGKKLRRSVRLQHSFTGKHVLAGFSKSKAGLDMLSGEYIPERPTFRPISERRLSDTISNENLISKLVQNRDATTGRPSCIDFHKAYREGVLTPVNVAESVLSAIDDSNRMYPPLQAIVEYDKNEVLRMAEESADRWSQGKPLSYLDGVPISVKAQYNVLPYQCTGGCSFQPVCAKGIPESIVVDRLKKAGAIIIGIANMQEAAAGTFGSNPNKMFKIARNPYNTDFFCGGSSSGSGCSVAAGLCPISLGSDDGGSIRIPAALCGVFGLKPTYGLLDTTGFLPISHTVGVIGPLASSPVDIAVAMDIMSGNDNTLDLSDLDKDGIDDIKLGVYWEYFEHADGEVVSLCKAAVKKMTGLGAVCHSIKIAELTESLIAHLATATVEFGSTLALDVDSHFDDLSAETLSLVGLGYSYSGTDYINCQKQRTRAIHVLQKLFEEVDVIVTPLIPCTAPRIPPGSDEYGLLSNEFFSLSVRFTTLANLCGIPSIAVPVGLSSDGLPISLQVMGPWFEEGRLIRIASVLEKEVTNGMKLPAVNYDVLNTKIEEIN